MDGPPKQRRLQFGVGGLLLFILALAILLAVYRAIPPDRPLLNGRLWVGATKEDVVEVLGEPTGKAHSPQLDTWFYVYPVAVTEGHGERRTITVFFQHELAVSAWDQTTPVKSKAMK